MFKTSELQDANFRKDRRERDLLEIKDKITQSRTHKNDEIRSQYALYYFLPKTVSVFSPISVDKLMDAADNVHVSFDKIEPLF